MSEIEIAEIAPKKGPNPQKIKWANIAYYDSFDEADAHRKNLDGLVKVRRCGPDGTKFVVKLGKKLNNGEENDQQQ
tara:strand:- start:1494 stop:1721 length:228 start_codon:yes stop_codon:yes gene_type:complete